MSSAKNGKKASASKSRITATEKRRLLAVHAILTSNDIIDPEARRLARLSMGELLVDLGVKLPSAG